MSFITPLTLHLRNFDFVLRDKIWYRLHSVFNMYPYNLKAANIEDIESSVAVILKSYHDDFARSFVSEEDISDLSTVSDFLQLMYNNRMMSFLQFQKVLVLFLIIPVLTVVSEGRSSSNLKLIKTYLPSKMSRNKLTNLAIPSIENIVSKSLNKTKQN